MPFHVHLFTKPPADARSRFDRVRPKSFYWVNIDENAVRMRIVEPWDHGDVLSWSGQSASAHEIEHIEIFETESNIAETLGGGDRYEAMKLGADVTNSRLLGAAGRSARTPVDPPEPPASRKDPRRVMVVHGRNSAARNAVFLFLRSLGLAPLEWEEAVGETGVGSPYNLEAVQAALDVAQAVVVVLTAEDQAGLLPSLADRSDSSEVALQGQPRQNVMLEAGMAIGTGRATTILVELGPIRTASDFDGLNTVRLTNDPQRRAALRARLLNAGCAVDAATQDWLTVETAGDFEGAVVAWVPQAPASLDFVVAIPSTELRSGQRAELSLRCYRVPIDGEVTCTVTPPAGEPVTTHADGASAGADQLLYLLAYPENFAEASIVAGTHAVAWTLAVGDGEHRELAVSDFRFP
jgi:predicted nucleotide-binding protein